MYLLTTQVLIYFLGALFTDFEPRYVGSLQRDGKFIALSQSKSFFEACSSLFALRCLLVFSSLIFYCCFESLIIIFLSLIFLTESLDAAYDLVQENMDLDDKYCSVFSQSFREKKQVKAYLRGPRRNSATKQRKFFLVLLHKLGFEPRF